MKIKLKDLEDNIPGVYKITYPNGKIYIGISSNIKRRMHEHNYNKHDTIPPCDKAIQQYGKIQEIDILEILQDEQLRLNREKYWIAYYDSTNPEKGYNISKGGMGGLSAEDSPNAVFTNEQVLDIRKRRYNGERKCNVYKDYTQFSFSTFEHIWLGRGYSQIGMEYYIQTNSKSRQEYSSNANKGENNNKAKLTEQDVKNIRYRFDNGETWINIHKDYQQVELRTIRRICKRETWKHVL